MRRYYNIANSLVAAVSDASDRFLVVAFGFSVAVVVSGFSLVS
jgi:hypothetical protein